MSVNGKQQGLKMLNINQVNRLKQVSVANTAASGRTNYELTALVSKLKRESPYEFHTKDTLKFRVFVDQPLHIPESQYKNYLRAAPKF